MQLGNKTSVSAAVSTARTGEAELSRLPEETTIASKQQDIFRSAILTSGGNLNLLISNGEFWDHARYSRTEAYRTIATADRFSGPDSAVRQAGLPIDS